MKKNKHNMKLEPHQEQKIGTARPQSSIFMGNFQFYQDRKTVRIDMLCDLNAKFSFRFYINIRTTHISSVYVYINYIYIKSRFGPSQYKYLLLLVNIFIGVQFLIFNVSLGNNTCLYKFNSLTLLYCCVMFSSFAQKKLAVSNI